MIPSWSFAHITPPLSCIIEQSIHFCRCLNFPDQLLSSIDLTNDKISQLLKDAEENKTDDYKSLKLIEETERRQNLIRQAERILQNVNKRKMYNSKRIGELIAEIGLCIQNNESNKIISKTNELDSLLNKTSDFFGGFGDLNFDNFFQGVFENPNTKTKQANNENIISPCPEKRTDSEKVAKDEKNQIPNAVCAVVAEVIGTHYYNHSRLNTLFYEAGAPGDVPQGNCVDKCTYWLKRCNDDQNIDAYQVLGKVLEYYMEVASIEPYDNKGRLRIEKTLDKYGLRYLQGGIIIGESIAVPTKSLQKILEQRSLPAVQIEFERAIADVQNDPEASLTAACAIVESICKIFIEENNLPKPNKETLKDLWKVVAANLGFNPASIEDEDLRRVLSGLSSIIDGLGSIRTHAGSAHGRGKYRYKVAPRHARLVIHAAHTLSTFVYETWQEKDRKLAG